MVVESILRKAMPWALAASTFVSSPAVARDITVMPDGLEQKIEQVMDNSRYVADPNLVISDNSSGIKTKDAKDSVGLGGMKQIMDFVLAVPGKLRRPALMGDRHFGKRMPNYAELDWHRFNSQHLTLGAYGSELDMMSGFVRSNEEFFSELREVFDFDEFQRRPVFLLYRDGNEFLQDKLFYPSGGVLGVTKVLGENQMAVFSSGYKEQDDSVDKHEFVHWFDLQRMRHLAHENGVSYKYLLENMESWMVEGLAESYSHGWTPTHESIVRDLWRNGVFPPVDQLSRFSGSFLTYTLGAFYTNFIEERFGKGTALKLRDGAAKHGDLDAILEYATGYKAADISLMARESLQERFRGMSTEDLRKTVAEGFLLAADDGRFVTLDYSDGHIRMHLNKILDNGEGVQSRMIQDAEYGAESMFSLQFSNGVGLRGNRVLLAVNDSGRDKLVMQGFREGEAGFDLGWQVEKEFDEISRISSPQFMEGNKVVFVGLKDGSQDIYSYDFDMDSLSRVTSDGKGVKGLDYSTEAGKLVFSLEGEKVRDWTNCNYNYDIFTLDLETGERKRVASGIDDETNPRFSPDGRRIVFQRADDFVNTMYLHDLESGLTVQLDSEIVGAESPQFLDPDTIVFNTSELLAPKVKAQGLARLESMVKEELERMTSVDGGVYAIRGNELVLKKVIHSGDDVFRIHGKPAERIVSGGGRVYFITEDGTFRKSGSKLERYTPKSLEDRAKRFKSGIPEDMKFLERSSMVYDVHVSEDGRNALMFLNEKFFDPEAFRKQGFDVSGFTEDSTPILLYSRGDSMFRKGRKPQLSFLGDDNHVEDKSPEVEFMAGNHIVIHSGRNILFFSRDEPSNPAPVIQDAKDSADIDGEIYKTVFSRDKRYAALLYLDDGIAHEDYAVVAYDSVSNTAKVLESTGGYHVHDLQFLRDGRLFFARENAKGIDFMSYDPASGELLDKHFTRRHGKGEPMKGMVASSEGVLFSVNDKGKNELYYGEFGNHYFRKLSEGRTYSDFMALDDIVIYTEKDIYGREETKAVKPSTRIISQDAAKPSVNNKVIIGDGDSLYALDIERNSVREIARDVLGFDVSAERVVMGMPKDGVFNLFEYDVTTEKFRQVTDNGFDSFRPLFINGAIYYEAEEDGESYVRTIKGGVDQRLPLAFPTSRLGYRLGQLYGHVRDKKIPDEREVKDYSYEEVPLLEAGRFSPWPIHERRGKVLAGYGGGWNVLGLIDYMGFNELHTSLASANVYASPYFKMGSLGYYDLDDDYAVKAGIVSFGRNIDTGLTLAKSFPVNSYFGFDAFTSLNYQDYPGYEDGVRKNVYPAVGASVSYDDTTFDYLRGPREGFRGYFQAESGYSFTEGDLNNYDANLDARYYLPFSGRFGSSYRFMAGTSQGFNNHVFLLGGNVSMRGVPFDSLQGQNYAVANVDVQLPIFEAVGAVLPGTNYFHPMFTAFDVRAGMYFDAGYVSYNEDWKDSGVLYSGGIDMSAICLGSIILRYNKGVFGQKDWNFWFGYSP